MRSCKTVKFLADRVLLQLTISLVLQILMLRLIFRVAAAKNQYMEHDGKKVKFFSINGDMNWCKMYSRFTISIDYLSFCR